MRILAIYVIVFSVNVAHFGFFNSRPSNAQDGGNAAKVEAEDPPKLEFKNIQNVTVDERSLSIRSMILCADGKSIAVGSASEDIDILIDVYQWNPGKNSLARVVANLASWNGMFGAPSACIWKRLDNGVEFISVGAKPENAIRLTPGVPITGIVAGNLEKGFAVQRIEGGEFHEGTGVLRLWDIKSSKVRHDLNTKTSVKHVALSPDGKLLAAVGLPLSKFHLRDVPENSGSEILSVWNTKTGELVYRRNMGYYVRRVQFSPSGSRLLCAGFGDQFLVGPNVGYVDVLEPRRPGWSQRFELNTWIWFAAQFFDDRRVVVGGMDGTIRLLNTESAKVEATLTPKQEGIAGILIHGQTLYTGGNDGTICAWQLLSK
ncbi:hypothetical protein GC197_15990 [bacterium]|nr:hypothetical protein [bacterium]